MQEISTKFHVDKNKTKQTINWSSKNDIKYKPDLPQRLVESRILMCNNLFASF